MISSCLAVPGWLCINTTTANIFFVPESYNCCRLVPNVSTLIELYGYGTQTASLTPPWTTSDHVLIGRLSGHILGCFQVHRCLTLSFASIQLLPYNGTCFDDPRWLVCGSVRHAFLSASSGVAGSQQINRSSIVRTQYRICSLDRRHPSLLSLRRLMDHSRCSGF